VGEYKYNNPMDRHWFRFTGVIHEALKAELAKGKGDGEILAWVQENAPTSATHGKFSTGARSTTSAARTVTWRRWSSLPSASVD